MSRSYREPASAICCTGSAKDDKRLAHRGERRAHQQYLQRALKDENYWDEVPFPVRLECAWNEVYSWGRDGHQSIQTLGHNVFNPYWVTGYSLRYKTEEYVAERIAAIEKLKRK